MRKFRIIRITEFEVEADFEDEAIELCRKDKANSSQTKYIRFKEMGEE